MKPVLILLGLTAGLLTLTPSPADAVVCARGVYRAGCVGPGGSVAVRRGVYGPRRVVARRGGYVGPRRTTVYRRR
jgi:hypothetical protein